MARGNAELKLTCRLVNNFARSLTHVLVLSDQCRVHRAEVWRRFLLAQFRHWLVAIDHVMRAAGKIGEGGLIRIDAQAVIDGRVHFTKMYGSIGNRGA